MNFKDLMASSFGLGLVNTIITYPASLLLQLPISFDAPKILIAFPLFGVLATVLYTIFYYPYRISYAFIVASLIYMQLISMIIRAALLLFSSTQRNLFFEQLHQLPGAPAKVLATIPLNFLIQVAIWFSVILVSNRLAAYWVGKAE